MIKDNKKEQMAGKYNDFQFIKNKYPSVILKKEIPIFYNKNMDYSCGKFMRVVFPSTKKLEINKLYKNAIASLFYLNPNMTESQFQKIYNTYKKIEGFGFSFHFYKELYDGRLDIKRKDCFFTTHRFLLNEIKFSKDNGLKLYSEKFKEVSHLWFKQNAKRLYSEWLTFETRNYFLGHLHTWDISPERIMEVFDIKQKRTIEKHLANSGIFFNNNSVEYIDDNGDKIVVELTDLMDDVIIKNIKHFIIQKKEKITLELLLKECKYVTNQGVFKKLNKKRLYEFYKKYPEQFDKVKEYNNSFDPEEIIIEKLNTKQKFTFLKVDEKLDEEDDDNFFDNTPIKDVSNYYINRWGKKVYRYNYDLEDLDNPEIHLSNSI